MCIPKEGYYIEKYNTFWLCSCGVYIESYGLFECPSYMQTKTKGTIIFFCVVKK